MKKVAQVCDVVLRKIKYWTEKRRRVAVVVPPQRVLESRYAIVAEVNTRISDQLSPLNRPRIDLRHVVICQVNYAKFGQIGCDVKQVRADRQYIIAVEVHDFQFSQVVEQAVL